MKSKYMTERQNNGMPEAKTGESSEFEVVFNGVGRGEGVFTLDL